MDDETTVGEFKVTTHRGVKAPTMPGIAFDKAAIELVVRFKAENPGLQKFEAVLTDGSKLTIRVPKPARGR